MPNVYICICTESESRTCSGRPENVASLTKEAQLHCQLCAPVDKTQHGHVRAANVFLRVLHLDRLLNPCFEFGRHFGDTGSWHGMCLGPRELNYVPVHVDTQNTWGLLECLNMRLSCYGYMLFELLIDALCIVPQPFILGTGI